MAFQHGASAYRARGIYRCRCLVCRAAATQRSAEERARRYASRVWVGDRLVAVNARVHGTHGTYSNWGCRCLLCTTSQAQHSAVRRDRLRGEKG
jgi:hypothetical protein